MGGFVEAALSVFLLGSALVVVAALAGVAAAAPPFAGVLPCFGTAALLTVAALGFVVLPIRIDVDGVVLRDASFFSATSSRVRKSVMRLV